jgi:stage II sporulation protein R
MTKAIKLLINTVLVLALTLTVALLPTDKDAAIYDDTLRLHILANSDGEADQSVKYRIRDRLLEKYAGALKDAESFDDAEERIEKIIPEIKKDVDAWLKEEGYDYGSKVTLGVEWYDTREYEDFSLPKGYYTSLKVMLGEAEGQNWWCVMYPPMCLDIATEDAPRDDAVMGYSKEEYLLIKDGTYNVKFKLLELFSDTFAKNG